jgi:hypothetical protein
MAPNDSCALVPEEAVEYLGLALSLLDCPGHRGLRQRPIRNTVQQLGVELDGGGREQQRHEAYVILGVLTCL